MDPETLPALADRLDICKWPKKKWTPYPGVLVRCGSCDSCVSTDMLRAIPALIEAGNLMRDELIRREEQGIDAVLHIPQIRWESALAPFRPTGET